MFLAYRTATLDIITEYLFGLCQNHVNYPDFEAPLLIDIQTSVPLLWLLKSFSFLRPILPYIPRWLAPRVHDQFRAFLSIQTFLIACLDRCKKEAKAFPDKDHGTICHSLLNPSIQAQHASSTLKPDYFDEVFSLIQAGSDTVGNTCTVGTFYILNDKRILLRLIKELRSAWPESEEHIDLSVLQSLPYLVSFYASLTFSGPRNFIGLNRLQSSKKPFDFLMALLHLFRGLWALWGRKSRDSKYRLQ